MMGICHNVFVIYSEPYHQGTDLPVFVQLPDCFLQRLLLLLGQNIGQLVTGLEESVQDPLIQLTKELLREEKEKTSSCITRLSYLNKSFSSSIAFMTFLLHYFPLCL